MKKIIIFTIIAIITFSWLVTHNTTESEKILLLILPLLLSLTYRMQGQRHHNLYRYQTEYTCRSVQNQHYDRNHFQYYQLLITVFTLPTDWDTKRQTPSQSVLYRKQCRVCRALRVD